MQRAIVGVLIVLALVSGCGGDGRSGDDDDAPAIADASIVAIDATSDVDAALPDAAPGDQVTCGGVLCDPFNRCCVAPGPIYECIGSVDSCAGEYVDCDGPEDCPGDAVCCSTNVGGAHCQTSCDDTPTVCHVRGDCPNGQQCCAVEDSLSICAPQCID